jgi:hypothetical protein
VFKVRLSFLQAINRVGVMFGGNERIEDALWWLMDRIHATGLEERVLSDSLKSGRNAHNTTGDK